MARSETAQQASARAYPSARLSNEKQRPRGEVIPATAQLQLAAGESITFTPSARAALHSCISRACFDTCVATSEDEHAVSNEAHGPCSPSA